MEKYLKEINKYIQHVKYDNFEYAVNISLMNKYVFVETPKVGCSTIKDTLQRMELEYPELIRDDENDIHERKYSPLLSPSQTCGFDRILNNPDYFIFCFVRNPYVRLLSSYLDKIARATRYKGMILASMGEDCSDLSKEISFHEFVDVISEQSVSQMDSHWRVQFYQTFQDSINYDFIGKMENFKSDCNYVFSKINENYSDYDRSVLIHATNAGLLLNKYYSDDIQEKVFNKFKIDFEHFGYDENSLL